MKGIRAKSYLALLIRWRKRITADIEHIRNKLNLLEAIDVQHSESGDDKSRAEYDPRYQILAATIINKHVSPCSVESADLPDIQTLKDCQLNDIQNQGLLEGSIDHRESILPGLLHSQCRDFASNASLDSVKPMVELRSSVLIPSSATEYQDGSNRNQRFNCL